jgi:hypothetical protein
VGTNGHRDLDLDIDDTPQLEFVGDETGPRFYTRVIGYLPQKRLLVITPLRDGILAANVRPYPYLHLSCSKKLEMIVVREAHRARNHLLASLQHRETDADDAPSFPAIIVDISTTGALPKSEEPIGDVDKLITMSTRMTVGEVQEYLDLPSMVRNVYEEPCDDRLELATGIEFIRVGRRDSVTLCGYVYECLINE